jgi:hypothetical protein
MGVGKVKYVSTPKFVGHAPPIRLVFLNYGGRAG